MRLESPWALALLVLVPLAWAWMRRAGWRGSRGTLSAQARDRVPSVEFPTAALAAASGATLRTRLLGVPAILRAIAVALVVLALARPQAGEGRVLTTTEAVAVQVVVDRSGSMTQQMEFGGVVLTRLDVVKRVLRAFLLGDGGELSGRPSDLTGLVAFARHAESLTPLVQDPEAIVAAVDAIEPAEARWESGTAIGDALALGAARLRRLEEQSRLDAVQSAAPAPVPGAAPGVGAAPLNIRSKVVVLLTDGSNNAGRKDPLEAARLAAEWGIKTHVIGIGGDVTIQRFNIFGREQTQVVPSDMDESTLQEIARITGGIYRRAEDGEALRRIAQEIDALERTTVQRETFVRYRERFPALVIAAGVVLLAELLLTAGLLRRAP